MAITALEACETCEYHASVAWRWEKIITEIRPATETRDCCGAVECGECFFSRTTCPHCGS
jgi:hypothetical protein